MVATTQEFITRAKGVHGSKYIYNKTRYVHSMQKIIITCPIHGDFLVTPNSHLTTSRSGCQKCSKKYRPTTKEFIMKAIEVHGGKYDYSKSTYINNKVKVEIICSKHGSFYKKSNDHIVKLSGCPMCGNKKKGTYHKRSTVWFVQTAKTIHGNKYDYSKVNYTNYHTKVEIICSSHGSFFQSAGSHLHNKNSCPQCYSEHRIKEGGYNITYFRQRPERKTLPATLYLIELQTASEKFIKVGITQKPLNVRFSQIPTYRPAEIMTYKGPLFELFQIEQTIKKWFKEDRYKPQVKFAGHTECFVSNAKQEIQQFITNKYTFGIKQ